MRTRASLPLFAAGAAVLSAALACTAPPRVADGFAVAVRDHYPPEYAWDGPAAFSIQVAPAAAPTQLLWGLADSTHVLRSPLHHGVTPHGATAVVPRPATLRPGTTYLVTVTLADGRTGRRQFTLPSTSP